MKKILSFVIFSTSLLLMSNGAMASQCGVGYSGYHRPAPTRAAVVHYQRQNHRGGYYSRNQCVRVDGRITRAERSCLSNRHYQRPRVVHYQRPMPRHGYVTIRHVPNRHR